MPHVLLFLPTPVSLGATPDIGHRHIHSISCLIVGVFRCLGWGGHQGDENIIKAKNFSLPFTDRSCRCLQAHWSNFFFSFKRQIVPVCSVCHKTDFPSKPLTDITVTLIVPEDAFFWLLVCIHIDNEGPPEEPGKRTHTVFSVVN